jgi:hypothetical protein
MIGRSSTQIRRSAKDLMRCYKKANSPLFEIARVLVRRYHIASLIVNANHGIM